MVMKELISKIRETTKASKQELMEILVLENQEQEQYLFEQARMVSKQYYGNEIYVRGLIEFTNYCKNDCYYCGIRKSNENAIRYRLTKEEIMECCKQGYSLGYRTFVLQGGEDGYFTDERMIEIIQNMKKEYPDCALTLSLGEREKESYEAFYKAGADRYLLREETVNEKHYQNLHPHWMSLKHRLQCLNELKEIGYQTGCGFMLGSPGQTVEDVAQELLYIKRFEPHMIGMGPFIPHQDTKFRNHEPGSFEMALRCISLLRLMNPNALIPSTTAMGTLRANGREQGILAGANVVMPNLSPVSVRKKYSLYDNKICTGEEAAECKGCLEKRMESIGYKIVVSKGDFVKRKQ